MKSIALSANERTSTGGKNAAQLRREGLVPGVLYGGKDNQHFSVRELDLRKLTHTTLTYIVEIDVEGKKFNALLKEVQYHPVTDKPIHVDFIELADGEKTRVKLALSLIGQSAGVRLGGKLSQPLRKLVVAGVPAELPESVEVDISEMKVGDTIRISDLNIDGGEILGRGDSVVAAVKTARNVVEEEEEEAAAAAAAAAAADGAEAPAAEGAEAPSAG